MHALVQGERSFTPECPGCGNLLLFTLPPGEMQADGTLLFDGSLIQRGIKLHLEKACSGRDE
jgi:hypothetical protein